MTHVLVTRPVEASRDLARSLAELGLVPVVMPLYTFSAIDPGPSLTLALSSRRARKLAVFTSPRSVQFGLSHIPAKLLDDLELAAIGSATRAKLKSSGCEVHLQATTGFTSEDLLKLPELAVDPGEAIIFCAPGGRKTLAKGLAALGWNVTNAFVYERIPLQPGRGQIDLLSDANELLSVWTSISAINIAKTYLPAPVWAKILKAEALVISARIQHHLLQLGATSVVLADGPGNAALIESLKRLTESQAPPENDGKYAGA